MKTKLLGLNLDELRALCTKEGFPAYSATQIADWLYKKRVTSFDQMTNLSKKIRQVLSEKYEMGSVPYLKYALSKDGTKKYLFEVKTSAENASCESSAGSFVEAVMIPDKDRKTLCVSSQAGCRMNCCFCMTGRMGFHGQMDAAQIISQFLYIDEAEEITNAVFMGMGEPLDNIDNVIRTLNILTSEWGFGWSPKRITLSSIGINKALRQKAGTTQKSPLERFLDESHAHLAISLHNPFHAERLSFMPSEAAFPIEQTLQIIRRYDFTGQRRVSFEYIMFSGLNDTKKHAEALIAMLKNLECRVNLIRFHDIGDTKYKPSSLQTIEGFLAILGAAGITATLRASRGQDIEAACGMLSGKLSLKKV